MKSARDFITSWYGFILTPNCNGRHARLATDLLLRSLGQEPFSWGSANLVNVNDARAQYVDALRAADRHDIRPLLNFVRS